MLPGMPSFQEASRLFRCFFGNQIRKEFNNFTAFNRCYRLFKKIQMPGANERPRRRMRLYAAQGSDVRNAADEAFSTTIKKNKKAVFKNTAFFQENYGLIFSSISRGFLLTEFHSAAPQQEHPVSRLLFSSWCSFL